MIVEGTIVGRMRLMRLTGPMRLIGHIGLMGLIGLIGLTGCSGDATVEPMEPEVDRSVPIALTGYARDYEVSESSEASESNRASKANGFTRAWTPPTGYSVPVGLKSIGGYFTKDGSDPEARRFWNTSSGWRMDEEVTSGAYQLYGYSPYNACESSSIDANGTYAAGAVLTLTGLDAVSAKDVCIIVGAKEGTGTETVSDLNIGKFDCTMKSGEGSTNHLFLLMEHLYAAVQFRFILNSAYHELRRIHLKKLVLMAYSDASYSTPVSKSTNATVTLLANESGTSPIQSISFSDPSGEDMQELTFFEGDEEIPTSTGTEEQICYVPNILSDYYYKLKSTYDVYDSNGNLIRPNCEAENDIGRVYTLFTDEQRAAAASDRGRGKKYTVRLTVNPTYLYQLSEPDLDNPTVELGGS